MDQSEHTPMLRRHLEGQKGRQWGIYGGMGAAALLALMFARADRHTRR